MPWSSILNVFFSVFQQRVLEQRAQAAKLEESKSQKLYCHFCKKKFGSEKSYENHLPSKKHQENVLINPDRENQNVAKSSEKAVEKINIDDEEELEEEMVEDDEEWEDVEEAIPVSQCLFCNHKSDSLENNLEHMSVQHSFFIPDVEFVIDIEGLLNYLGERVGQGKICLWCGHLGRQFASTDACQKHMIDKGHYRMFHEGEVLLEYTDFYDYSSSYPDEGDADEEVELNVLNDSGFELVLPSGATIGHRSLNRYYRYN